MALVLVNAWLMTQSVLLLDSARDFSYALDIAQGRVWHLMGPEFGGFIHTGPIWFYLLALPLLSGSLWLTAFFIGLLAGIKIILAFYLGKQWFNTRFGVLWSACLLIPGWHSINHFIPGHINVIDTLVLAFVASLWQFVKTKQIGWLYLSGLVLAFSLHAHVTALIAAVLYLPVLWRLYGHWRYRHLLMVAVLFALPFVPYFWSQVLDGFGDWTRWQALTQDIDQMRRGLAAQDESFLSALMGNLNGLLLGGVQRMQGFVASVWPLFGTVYWGLFFILSGIVLGHWSYRLWRDKSKLLNKLKPLLLAFVLLFVGLVLITALRSFTPFYMLFVLTPLLAFMWAWLLSVGGQSTPLLTYGLVLVLMVLSSLPILSLQKAVYDGQVHLGSLGNIRQDVDVGWQTDFNTLDALTVSDAEVWADFLCQQAVQIHGPGALVLDLLSALPMRLSCPEKTVLLGGKPQQGYQQWLLMHRSFWDVTALQPDQWLTAAWGLSQNIELYNDHQALQAVDFNNYIHPPRQLREKQVADTLSKQIQSNQQAVLMVTHLLPFYTMNSIKSVTANGHKAQIIMANIGNSLYYCSACQSGPVDWRITVRSNDPEALDIILLKNHE